MDAQATESSSDAKTTNAACAGSRMAGEASRLLRGIGVAGRDDLEAARQHLLDQIQDFSMRLEAFQDDATHAARSLGRSARQEVRDHPWRTIGIAAGAGILIGLLASRRS